jgi:PhnB protein
MKESLSKGKTMISPLLNVRRGAQAIDFYKAAFGAEEEFRVEDPDGAVVAKMTVGGKENGAVGGAGFWLADESPENGNFSPESMGGSTVRMVMVVDDPDQMFERAVAAGATVVWPVEDKEYGWRVGRVADPYGHHWEIGKPLKW